MAIRFASQNGNWSDPLTWDDGLTIPTTGDEVYLNNYNITIDQNITTGFISNSITPIGVPLDPIPDMTSNTSPVGVGQAFATQNNITAWKVFRKGLNTFSPSTDNWIGAVNGGQIGYQFDTPKSIQRYAWHQNSATGSRPKDWTFQGSNDGAIWVTLHTVVAAASAATYNSPNISNPSSYTYYRINVTAVQSVGFNLFLNALSMTESTSLGNGYLSGGTATIPASRTVNGDFFHSTGTLITISATSPSVVNITGNMPGSVPAANNSRGLNITGNCTVNYVGNVVSTTSNAVSGVRGIIVGAGATINLTGDCSAGAANTTLGGTNSSDGIHLENNSTLNMVGNVFGGFANAGNSGIRLVGTNQTISITGNVNGLSGTSITNPNPAVLLNGTAVFSITGNLTAGQNAPALYGPNATTEVQVFGNVQNASNGYMATIAPYVYLDAAVTQWEFRKSNLTTNTLYTPGVAIGFPATNNVRTGIVYGPTSNLTGTCAVPPAAAVSLGVPVDNTVGTASLDANALAAALNTSLQASLPTPIATALNTSLSASLPAAIAPLLWDEDVANLTTPNSIGERLKNCSTVATTGAQIASFNP
jgi:hypothetical protein